MKISYDSEVDALRIVFREATVTPSAASAGRIHCDRSHSKASVPRSASDATSLPLETMDAGHGRAGPGSVLFLHRHWQSLFHPPIYGAETRSTRPRMVDSLLIPAFCRVDCPSVGVARVGGGAKRKGGGRIRTDE